MNQPSPETLKLMLTYFQKTSLPRLIKKHLKNKEEQNNEQTTKSA